MQTRTARTHEGSPDADWLARFHAGDRALLASCYREHFATIRRSLGQLVSEPDQETIIHEVFSALLAREDLRRQFEGGQLAAWLVTVARHRALDYRRRIQREVHLSARDDGRAAPSGEHAAHARLLVARFRESVLPAAWDGVFELRFLQRLPQREAAARLRLHRTTLAYRELRIRQLLRRFLTAEEAP